MSDDNNERKENSWVPSAAEQQAIEDWQMFLIGRALKRGLRKSWRAPRAEPSGHPSA